MEGDATSYRHEAASLAFHQGGYDVFERDLGGAKDSPSNLVHKWAIPLRCRAPPHAVSFAAMLRTLRLQPIITEIRRNIEDAAEDRRARDAGTNTIEWNSGIGVQATRECR